MPSDTSPILNLDRASLRHWRHGTFYEADMAQIGKQLGAQKLGYRFIIVPPGKAAWPRHAHLVNEEMLFILSGTGQLEIGPHQWPVQTGDVVALLPGPEHAHRLINTGSASLQYLCISTMEQPDIVLMPDSEKINVMAGSPPGGDKAARTLSLCFPLASAVDYWDGENAMEEQ